MSKGTHTRPMVETTPTQRYSAQAQRAIGTVEERDKRFDFSRVSPKKRSYTTGVKFPILLGMDGTGSMEGDIKVMWDKGPRYQGMIVTYGWLPGSFATSFVSVNDANTDDHPIQATDFVFGNAYDEAIESLNPRGRGGGQGMESYELLAYLAARHVEVPEAEEAFMFVFGDEGYYPWVIGTQVHEIFGDDTSKWPMVDISYHGRARALPSDQIWEEAKARFTIFRFHRRYRTSGSILRSDKEVYKQWRDLLGVQTIVLEAGQGESEGKAVVDAILGVLALRHGQTMKEFQEILRHPKDETGASTKGQSEARIEAVTTSLAEYAASLRDSGKRLPTTGGVRRKSGTKRL
jgi:hypothetical protein